MRRQAVAEQAVCWQQGGLTAACQSLGTSTGTRQAGAQTGNPKLGETLSFAFRQLVGWRREKWISVLSLLLEQELGYQFPLPGQGAAEISGARTAMPQHWGFSGQSTSLLLEAWALDFDSDFQKCTGSYASGVSRLGFLQAPIISSESEKCFH